MKKLPQRTVFIDGEQHAALKTISADTGIPIAALVRRAIAEHLKGLKK